MSPISSRLSATGNDAGQVAIRQRRHALPQPAEWPRDTRETSHATVT